jgi:hypothetical protein
MLGLEGPESYQPGYATSACLLCWRSQKLVTSLATTGASDEVHPGSPEHKWYRHEARGDQNWHAGVPFVQWMLLMHQAFGLFSEDEGWERVVWSCANLLELCKFCIAKSNRFGPQSTRSDCEYWVLKRWRGVTHCRIRGVHPAIVSSLDSDSSLWI